MRRVSLQTLETLCCIARLGTFHATALHMNTTQPAISARVRELENAVGVSLFHRNGRRMELTIQGRDLVHKVEPLLLGLENVMLSLENLDAATGVVRIGCGEIAVLSWFPSFIAKLKNMMPKIVYQVEVGLTATMRQRLESGKLDIAIMGGPIDTTKMNCVSLGTVRMIWVISPQLRRPDAPMLSSHEMLEIFPIWSLSKPSAIYPMAVCTLMNLSVNTKNIDTCDHMLGMIELIVKGAGIGLVPEVLALDYIDRCELELLSPDIPVPELEFFMAWNADQEQRTINTIVEVATQCSTFSKALPRSK